MADIEREFADLADFTASMNDKEKADLDTCLAECNSLEELKNAMTESEAVKKFQERYLGDLLDADTLEDCGTIQNQTIPSHAHMVRWKGGHFEITLPVGTLAETLREEVAERLSKTMLDQCKVHASQVHLGVVGLSVELDYYQQIPEAVKGDLQANVVQRNWQDIVNAWSADSSQEQNCVILTKKWAQKPSGQEWGGSWASSADFCRVVGIIDVVQRKWRSDTTKLDFLEEVIKEAVHEETPPADVLRIIQRDFALEPKELKTFYKLLGEPDSCLHLKLESACKFLDHTINQLTQAALYNGGQLARIRALQDQISCECELLPRALDIDVVASSNPEYAIQRLQEYLSSSPTLEQLWQRLRERNSEGPLMELLPL